MRSGRILVGREIEQEEFSQDEAFAEEQQYSPGRSPSLACSTDAGKVSHRGSCSRREFVFEAPRGRMPNNKNYGTFC